MAERTPFRGGVLGCIRSRRRTAVSHGDRAVAAVGARAALARRSFTRNRGRAERRIPAAAARRSSVDRRRRSRAPARLASSVSAFAVDSRHGFGETSGVPSCERYGLGERTTVPLRRCGRCAAGRASRRRARVPSVHAAPRVRADVAARVARRQGADPGSRRRARVRHAANAGRVSAPPPPHSARGLLLHPRDPGVRRLRRDHAADPVADGGSGRLQIEVLPSAARRAGQEGRREAHGEGPGAARGDRDLHRGVPARARGRHRRLRQGVPGRGKCAEGVPDGPARALEPSVRSPEQIKNADAVVAKCCRYVKGLLNGPPPM